MTYGVFEGELFSEHSLICDFDDGLGSSFSNEETDIEESCHCFSTNGFLRSCSVLNIAMYTTYMVRGLGALTVFGHRSSPDGQFIYFDIYRYYNHMAERGHSGTRLQRTAQTS